MSGTEVEIRPCADLKEFERCVELQRLVWGFEEAELVPLHTIVVAAHIGGQVFGAFDAGEMIGFLMAVPGIRHGRVYLHSHMAAVLAEHQGRGIGRRLKLYQRQEALQRGIELVEWTFDPLEFRNAHFNLERLGVIVRRYLRNQYGRTSSPLHGGLPTDRLVAEWWLASARVEAIVRDERAGPSGARERVTVPAAIHELKRTDRARAEEMQSRARDEFEKWFGQGYAATGFLREEAGGAYLLEPWQEGK